MFLIFTVGIHPGISFNIFHFLNDAYNQSKKEKSAKSGAKNVQGSQMRDVERGVQTKKRNINFLIPTYDK